MGIRQNIREVENRILQACQQAGRSPDEVTLVAITKTRDAAVIRSAFEAGIHHFQTQRAFNVCTVPAINRVPQFQNRLNTRFYQLSSTIR